MTEQQKCLLFMNEMESDFSVIIGEKTLPVHKSVLMCSSEYFNALFNSEMLETKSNEIALKNCLLKPFITVLKLCYDIHITDAEWNDMKIQELFESIITANYYQFIECERLLSQKMIDLFAYRILTEDCEQSGDKTCCNSMLTIWELLEMSKLHNLMLLNELCLNFVDENIGYAFENFDKQFVSADIVLDVISRDTFGAKEIEIFKLVNKWIRKNRVRNNLKCIEETLLLSSVRLSLISLEDIKLLVLKSNLYEREYIENVTSGKYELNSELSQNFRTCYESEKIFTTVSCNNVCVTSADKLSVCFTFMLLMPTKINHIMFEIKPLHELYTLHDNHRRFNANYWVGIPDSSAENGFKKIIDYRQHSCVGEQDLYFETPHVVDSVRILVETERSFIEKKSFLIRSLSYGFTRRPIQLVNNCICPKENVCVKFGAFCSSSFIMPVYTKIINEHVLGLTEEYLCYGPKQVRVNLLSHQFEKPLQANDGNLDDYDRKPYFLIRLPQPVYVDCLQFELQLDIDSFRDENVTANCQIDVCSSFKNDITSAVWVTVTEKSYLKKSGFYNVSFELQQVLALRISGFRVDNENHVKYPLNISNFKVPADRSSDYWVYGYHMQ